MIQLQVSIASMVGSGKRTRARLRIARFATLSLSHQASECTRPPLERRSLAASQRAKTYPRAFPLERVPERLKVRVASADDRVPELEGRDVGLAARAVSQEGCYRQPVSSRWAAESRPRHAPCRRSRSRCTSCGRPLGNRSRSADVKLVSSRPFLSRVLDHEPQPIRIRTTPHVPCVCGLRTSTSRNDSGAP
jgi:hypothetical protein